MYPPDWKILFSHVIFPIDSLMLLFIALLTQYTCSLMDKDNILSAFILIFFKKISFLIMLF